MAESEGGDSAVPVADDSLIGHEEPIVLKKKLCGYLNKLTQSKKGAMKASRRRWFVLAENKCFLYCYRNEHDLKEALFEIDISSSCFTYNADVVGEFSISCGGTTYLLDAGTEQNRFYWLQELQKARRDFSNGKSFLATKTSEERVKHTVGVRENIRTAVHTIRTSPKLEDKMKHMKKSEMGLLKSREGGIAMYSDGLSCELLPEVRKPEEEEEESPRNRSSFYIPQKWATSADECFGLSSIMISTISTDDSPGVPSVSGESRKTDDQEAQRPNYLNLISPNLQDSFSKLRNSFRTKKDDYQYSCFYEDVMASPKHKKSPKPCKFCIQLRAKVTSLEENLQMATEEAKAGKQAVNILNERIEILQKERESLVRLHGSGFSDDSMLEILREKDKEIVELQGKMNDLEKDKELLKISWEETQRRNVDAEEKAGLLRQTLQAKDHVIKKLDSELNLCQEESGFMPVMNFKRLHQDAETQTLVSQEEQMLDKVTAYENQNKFLNQEILELNYLRREATKRENDLLQKSYEWEAKFYQIQSKYLILLNELNEEAVDGGLKAKSIISQLMDDVVESGTEPVIYKGKESNYDELGFSRSLRSPSTESVHTLAETLNRRSSIVTGLLQANDEDSLSRRWESVLATMEAKGILVHPELKVLVRSGIPIQMRGRVWKMLIDRRLTEYRSRLSKHHYQNLLATQSKLKQADPSVKQIELDLLRTLPNNRHYASRHCDGIPKLRRVLQAYSIHNPQVGYCQGLNRVAAIALLFLNEEDAFWCLVYIVEFLMPHDFYAQNLLGAQVDQRVLKDIVSWKLSHFSEHIEKYGVDLSLLAFNWFLCIFVDNIPVQLYLRIWDAFLFEGNKVLFRFALAILKIMEGDAIRIKDHMAVFNYLQKVPETITDFNKVADIAFQELNPFPRRDIKRRREHHKQAVKNELAALDEIRKNFKVQASTSPADNSDDEWETIQP